MKVLFALLASLIVTGSTLGAAVFWRDPGPVESLDLAGGPGGARKAPKAPFTFVSEETGGTSAKIGVKDASGVSWLVKFGEEVKAENFSTRVVWSAGYFAVPTYYVSEGKLEGVVKLGRAAQFVQDGNFRDARFQLKDDKLFASAGKWNLSDAELKGSRDLAGYKLLMILLANWDVKPANLAVLDSNGTRIHAVTDWGATMGRPAELSGRSKWNCEQYTADSKHMVEGVENGFVLFNYQGKQGQDVARGIRVEDVAWMMQRLGKLSDPQITAALKASGSNPEEVSCFLPAFQRRLAQLTAVAKASSSAESSSTTTTRKETKKTSKEQ